MCKWKFRRELCISLRFKHHHKDTEATSQFHCDLAAQQKKAIEPFLCVSWQTENAQHQGSIHRQLDTVPEPRNAG